MPEGLHLTAAGKLHGRPEVVGDTNIGVRVAQPDGVLRRFELDLRVVNPAQPVSVSADGTFANGEVTEGVVLDDTHVAFVSTADNLGADNPNQASLVYLKNLTTGLLSYWRPSEEDRVCGIATDPAKANLYIATSRLEEDPSEPGEFRERIDVRVLQIDSHTYGAGEVAANLVTTFTGPCGGRLPVAALANGKLAVISPYRLDTVGEPYDSAEPPNRLYLWHGGAFTRVDNPIEDGAAWSSASFADVGSDGTLLIVGERLKSGVVKHIGELEAGYFSLDPNGTWERIDLDATGVPTAMSPPRLFGGGVVYGRERVVPLVRRATKPLVIRAPEGELRFKQLQPSDSVPFGAPRLNAFGITPLTSDSYAAACATFNGRHPLRTEPSTVFYEDVEIPSCLASPSGGGADPFEEAGATKMLVAGPVNGVRELLVAAVP